MALPYENSSSGKRAIEEIQKILRSFGCAKFATGEEFETGEIFIQFEHQGRPVYLKASAKGYAEAWLRERAAWIYWRSFYEPLTTEVSGDGLAKRYARKQ